MDFAALLEEFTAAVEAGDGRRLAALFTADGVYHDTFYGEFAGQEAIQRMLEERFHGDGADFRWDMRDPVCDGRLGYARWVFSYRSTLPGAGGRRVAVEGMSCFTLHGSRIERYDEVFDAGIALTQLDFAPERLQKLLRRWADTVRGRPRVQAHLEE